MKIAITQNFYDQMASQYDKLFQNWGGNNQRTSGAFR